MQYSAGAHAAFVEGKPQVFGKRDQHDRNDHGTYGIA